MNLEKILERDPISDRGLSVVIPVHNGGDSLAETIASVAAGLEAMTRGHEILVVDDCSTDNTASRVDKIAQENRRVRRLGHESHQGIGAAMRTGFRAAKYPLVLQWDAGKLFDSAEMTRMLQAIDRVDVICGFRERFPSGVAGWRYWLYRAFLRVVFGVTIRDVDCGCRLFRRAALRRIPIQSNGRFANAEVIAKATFMNLIIGEVPVSCVENGVGLQSPFPQSVFRDAAFVFRHPQFRTSNTTPDAMESLAQRA